jgi:AraC-like DNA-binding protein
MPLAAPLMQRHRIFHSQDAEETRTFLRGKEYQFDIAPRQAKALDVQLNGRYTPGMYLGYVHYGRAPVEFAPGLMRNDYWIQLPLRGQLEADVGGHSVICDPKRAAIASPAREKCRFLSAADSARIQLALTKPALLGHLTALLGEPPAAPPDFAPDLDLTAGYGQSLARYALMAAVDLDHDDSILLNPVTMRMFEQMIMTGLLLSHPHTYSEALRRHARPPAPRDIRRAIDYLEAHLDAPVTLADLVAASGVAGRTLLQHFRDTKGVSPIRYLRNVRFAKVREALLRAEGGDSVTAIAMSWGFTHMGRFAVEYRKRFGESPSETLRQRRIHGWLRPPG